ncbi:MAG: PqqD family protein [Gammaproteobacteria bacterium]|nr:PqqD family protein [Gammaproteobacteria bacterium]MDH3468900.1 PqqD family protein [Gammaproteobacteria bacterium]
MNDRIPSQNSQYHLEEMDGEVLLYNPADTKTVYLNETSSLIWNLCDGDRTIETIATLLEECFPDSDSSITDDVVATLEDFANHGAIEFR